MTAQASYLPAGKDTGTARLYMEVSVTCTSLSNVTASAVSTFPRAFAAVPKVTGINCDRAGCAITVIPTATGASFYVRGDKDGVKPDGAVLVSAVLEGYLA